MRFRDYSSKVYDLRTRVCTRCNKSFKGTKFSKICPKCDNSPRKK